MDVEERICRALEECKRGKRVRNPFAGTFGDTAMACVEMADGACRWKEVPMKREAIQNGTPSILAAR